MQSSVKTFNRSEQKNLFKLEFIQAFKEVLVILDFSIQKIVLLISKVLPDILRKLSVNEPRQLKPTTKKLRLGQKFSSKNI